MSRLRGTDAWIDPDEQHPHARFDPIRQPKMRPAVIPVYFWHSYPAMGIL
jgi:hypothetical protein